MITGSGWCHAARWRRSLAALGMTARALPLALSLGGRVVRIPSGGVVGGVEDLSDPGDQVADRLLDSLLQRDVGGAAALAAASQAEVDVVPAHVDQLDVASVRGDRRVDLPLEQIADRPLQVLLRGDVVEIARRDDRLARPDVLADDVADPERRPVDGMEGADRH